MGVEVSDSSNFSLSVFEGDIFVSNVVTSRLDDFVLFVDSNKGFVEIIVESLVSISLFQAFLGFHILDVSKSGDFTEHVSSLRFNKITVSLEFSNLASEINTLVTLQVALISVFRCFEEFLIKDSL